jgi:hypothetical protein
MSRKLEWMQMFCLTWVVNLVIFLTCFATGSYIQSEKCTKGYSSSTISCGTGFLFTEFRCDPSSSGRTSEPSSSLLSHAGWSEYSGGAGGFVVALRLFRNRSIIAARTSKLTIAAPTPIPAFAPALKPLFVVACEVSGEVGEEVAAPVVGVLVREGEAVAEALRLEEELVAGRSCLRYSTHIGCAHIVSGPVTVVILGAVLLARAWTAVEPEAIGYELMHPS